MKNELTFKTAIVFCTAMGLALFSGCQERASSPPGDLAEAVGDPAVVQPDFGIPDNAPIPSEVESPVLSIKQFTEEGNNFNSMYPKLARGIGGTTYLVWQQCRLGDACEKSSIMVARHDGSSWGESVEVSPLSEGSAHATSPDVAVDSSGTAHIIWKDSGTIGARPTDSDILYRSWSGEGAAGLGSLHTVSVGGVLDCVELSDCATVIDSKIALVGDQPAVAFSATGTARSFEVFYATVTNGSWSATQISDGSHDVPPYSAVGARYPDIGTDFTGQAYIVWVSQLTASNSRIQYRTVGDSLGAIQAVEDECNTNRVGSPKVAVDEFGVGHLVWTRLRSCDDPSGGMSVYYGKLSGAGVVGSVTDLTASESHEGARKSSPEIVLGTAEGSTLVSVAWASTAPIAGSGSDYDILMTSFKEVPDTPVIRVVSEPGVGLNTSAGLSFNPALVTRGAGVAVCWQEKDSTDISDFDITCTTGTGW